MALRLSLLAVVAILGASAVYVVHDRSHLAAQIRTRQAEYAACRYTGATASACAGAYGWSALRAAREGDLLGLPFFLLGAVLTVILVVRITIARPEPSVTAGIDVSSTVVPE